MSENRAAKSGLARDVKNKMDAKYNKEEAAECMRWLAAETGEPLDTSGDVDAVYNDLNDGYVLSKLIERIKPGSIPARYQKRQTMEFKKMEVIELFNKGIKNPPLELKQHDCFVTTDLREKQAMVQVITCLQAVARKCHALGGPVRGFGPKEAEANKRDFTDEQLAQGKSIIGLQMGSNKGATQSGQNFGKGRMIVD